MPSEARPPAQLPLPISLRPSSIFNSYYPGPNADAVAVLKEWPTSTGGPLLYLYGATGVGKSHLLQAMCARTGAQHYAAAYFPLRELHGYGPELLSGTEHLSLLCIDDIGQVATHLQWNQALFTVYRELEERGGKLIIADEKSPSASEFVLRDLASRVLASTVLRLQVLSDLDQLHALRLHAAQRGLELPDEVAGFLLRRLPRDMHSLSEFIDALDHASLSAQRKLTVPFVKQILAQR